MTRDITDYITFFINSIFSIISQVYSLLDSIYFSGISLLDYMIILTIVSFVIPLLISRAKTTNKE